MLEKFEEGTIKLIKLSQKQHVPPAMTRSGS